MQAKKINSLGSQTGNGGNGNNVIGMSASLINSRNGNGNYMGNSGNGLGNSIENGANGNIGRSTYTIKRQFLNAQTYHELLQNVLQYEQMFKSYLTQIIQFYRSSKTNPATLSQFPLPNTTLNSYNSQQISPFSYPSSSPSSISTMNAQILPFLSTLHSISSQHLSHISSILRQSAQNSIRRDEEKIILQVEKVGKIYGEVQHIYREIAIGEGRIDMDIGGSQDYYRIGTWGKRAKILERYAKALKQITAPSGPIAASTTSSIPQQPPIKKSLQSLQIRSLSFEEQIFQFRKKIINYKYGYLKLGVKWSRQLLRCLSEYLSLGFQALSRINGKMRVGGIGLGGMGMGMGFRGSGALERSIYGNGRDSYGDKNRDSYGENNYQNFNNQVQEYKKTLYGIQDIFYCHRSIVDGKVLLQQFRQAYQGNEILLTQMFDVWNLFQKLAQNRKQMYQKVSKIIQIIEQQAKQKKRASQVINTILKRKSLDESPVSSAFSARNSLSSQMPSIHEFSFKTIDNSIQQAIQFALISFKELSQMCYAVSKKITKSRQTGNNMSISEEYIKIEVKNKRPSKQEIWLWKDWRDFRDWDAIKPKFQLKRIEKEIEEIKRCLDGVQGSDSGSGKGNLGDGDESKEKISCDLEGKNSGRVSVIVEDQRIQIKHKKDESVHYVLPFSYIEGIQKQKKKLVIKLKGGSQIKLSGFKSLTQSHKKISQSYLSKSTTLPTSSSPPKPTIAITPQQLQAIQRRMPEIQQIRPKISSYTKYGQCHVKGLTAQQVYLAIFSDQTSCLLSSSSPFFQYINKKNKNYNITSTSYDSPGPYFYTASNKDITFLNCPLFSTRSAQFDHPLPKIPFLPSSCHCRSTEKIYWISQKEFQYNADVYSSGTQMMETFFTVSLYRVKESNGGVGVEIWNKIQFVKETSMKSILNKGAIGQIKALVPQIIKDIQKCLKLALKAKSSPNSTSSTPQPQPQPQVQSQTSTPSSSSSPFSPSGILQKAKENKNIILFLFLTVVINLLVHMIF